MTLNPLPPQKNRGFYWIFRDFGLGYAFQEWIAPKWLEIDQKQPAYEIFRHCYITQFFPCTNFFYPPGGILKTVNKFIVIKSNTKNLDKIRLKTAKIRAKKLQQVTKLCKGDMSQNSKTAKMVLGRYYRVLNFRLALTRLAIPNTWKILL